MSPTLSALLSYDVEYSVASGLAVTHTMGALRRLKVNQLIGLGLTTSQASEIKNSARPAIPKLTLEKVLHDAAYTCCICRDPQRGVIVHHIKEWSVSHNHDEENLVVLCALHHDQAHTTRELTRSLTPETILESKRTWVERVRGFEVCAILKIARLDGASWLYINHRRLFELADKLGVEYKKIPQYVFLLNTFVDPSGYLLPHAKFPTNPKYYLYDGGLRGPIDAYVTTILESSLQKLGFTDISQPWCSNEIARAKAGDLVCLQGTFAMRRLNKRSEGPGQARRLQFKSKLFSLTARFDAWECTSSSAQYEHLSGRKSVTGFFLIRSKKGSAKNPEISATCLALGTAYTSIRADKDNSVLNIIRDDMTSLPEEA